MQINGHNVFKLQHIFAIGFFNENQKKEERRKCSDNIDRKLLLEGKGDDNYHDCIQEEVEIGIAISDAGEIDHLVALLVIEDENDVAYQQEEHEITNNNAEFFGKGKTFDGEVETHNVEAEEHLVDKDQVENEIESIHFERKYFARVVIVLAKLVLPANAL